MPTPPTIAPAQSAPWRQVPGTSPEGAIRPAGKAAAGISAAPRILPATLASNHILVVDDDDGVRSAIVMALRPTGCAVHCAEDGEEGWQAQSAHPFDLLITDNYLPRLTGLGLLRRVRTVQPTLPVILISGSMPRGVADLSQLLTPGLALPKPFSVDELYSSISCLLFSSLQTVSGPLPSLGRSASPGRQDQGAAGVKVRPLSHG